MTRTTVAMAKQSRIPEALNVSPLDPRYLQYLNESTQRLLHRGKFWGTYGRFRIPASSQIISLPPQIDTIEAVAVSHVPLPLRDAAVEFIEAGWGTRDDTLPLGSGIPEVLYRGTHPTLVDIATPGLVTIKCDQSSDVNKAVLLLGEDENGNIIRTDQGGIADGEVLGLAQGAGTTSTKQYSKITGIQAPLALDGQWWLYLGDTSGTLLGNYQWFDVCPSWKRYLIPFINSTATTVEIMGKRAFFPVKNDADFLIIGNLAALKLACLACQAEEQRSWAEAQLLWNGGTDANGVKRIGALQELDLELQHHLGDGRQVGITIMGSNIGSIEPVEALM